MEKIGPFGIHLLVFTPIRLFSTRETEIYPSIHKVVSQM